MCAAFGFASSGSAQTVDKEVLEQDLEYVVEIVSEVHPAFVEVGRREALADRVDQTALIEHLKSQILRIVQARHAAQEKADREVAGVRKQMDDATERWVAEVDKLSNSLNKAKRKK